MLSANNSLIVHACETSYTGRIKLQRHFIIVLVGIDVALLLCNFMVNFLVISSLVLSKQLYNTSLKLVMFLSISDCCIACIVQPLFAVLFLVYPSESQCQFEMVAMFFAIFFTHTSGYIIALIGFDRFARIKYMTKYSSVMTEKRLKCLVITAIVLSLLQAALYVVGTHYSFFSKAKKAAVYVDFAIALLVLLTYLMAVYVARKYRRNAVNKEMLKSVDKTITKLASNILLSIVLFYIVYVAISMVHSSMANKVTSVSVKQWLEFLLIFGYLLTYANSVVNAVIFLCVNKKARKSLRKRFQQSNLNSSISTEDYAMTESSVTQHFARTR